MASPVVPWVPCQTITFPHTPWCPAATPVTQFSVPSGLPWPPCHPASQSPGVVWVTFWKTLQATHQCDLPPNGAAGCNGVHQSVIHSTLIKGHFPPHLLTSPLLGVEPAPGELGRGRSLPIRFIFGQLECKWRPTETMCEETHCDEMV